MDGNQGDESRGGPRRPWSGAGGIKEAKQGHALELAELTRRRGRSVGGGARGRRDKGR